MAAAAAGGVPPLNVSIRITTSGAKAAASAMSSVTRSSAKMSKGFGTGVITARTLGDSMRMSASLMKYTVAGAFMKVGTAALQAFRNFELSFSRIRGLVGVSADEVNKMKEATLGLAGATTRGPEELAEALYFITSAGIRDSATALSILEVSAKAAAAGLGETKVVADAVTSAMNAYGLGNLSATSATDILTAAVREGKAEADTFAPAFSKVLPVAAAFGASFNDVAAAMAALTRSGMTAGTAGIYVRQTLSQLLKPSKQGAEALEAVGTSAEEVRKNIGEKGLFAGLQELSTKLGGTEKGTEKFAKVFGNIRALTSMLQLVGPAAAENEEIFRRMSNTTGDLDFAFMSYQETIDAKFNKSLADSRVALIKMGEALKPVASIILDVGAMLSRAFTTLFSVLGGPISKGITAVVAGFVLLVVVMAGTMKTGSALIRLFANMIMTLTGTQIMYDANAKALFRLNAATGTTAVTTKALTKSTAISAMTAKGYTKVNFGLAASFAVVKKGIISAAQSMYLFMLYHPVIMAIAAAALVAAGAFIFFKKRADAAFKVSAQNLIDQLGKVNELLDQTVAYGTVKIGFKVDEDTAATTKLDADVGRIREQIEEQAPELINALDKVGDRSKSMQANIVKGLMESQFANLGAGPKEALLAMFQRDLNISDEQMAAAVISDVTGDSVSNALIQVGASVAASSSDSMKKSFEKTGKESIEGLIDVYKNAPKFYNSGEMVFENDVNESLTVLGKSFTDFANTGGDLTPLLLTMQKLDAAGINSADVYQKVLGTALTGLSGTYELLGDSQGDFFDVFAKDENIESGVLRTLIMQTAKLSETDADIAVKNIAAELEKVDPKARTASKGLEVVMGELDQYMTVSEDLSPVMQELMREFEGVHEALKTQIDGYKTAIDAIKSYGDSQRALRGLAQDEEEALRDVYDSYQSLAGAMKDGGGTFDIRTEGGREAREEIQKSAEELFNYANIIAETDPKRAGQIVKTGLENIASSVAQGGGNANAGMAFLASIGFTDQNFVDGIVAAKTAADEAARQTGIDLTTGIASGIQAGQPTLNAALITALNNVLIAGKAAIDSDSPSKLFAQKLGLPMAQGVGVGFGKGMNQQTGGMAKNLQDAIQKIFKTGTRKSIGKYLSDFLEKKKNVETPAQDFVKATIGRMKDIIGSLGNYIKSQLNFRDAQANLLKLINTQRKLDDDRKKAAREVQYSATRRGADGGAQVTGYEQSEIDELQIQFEKTSRDYAMGRATYTSLVDAEIALFEARAAAVEVNDEVISAQNSFIDATVEVENKSLNLAAATTDILEAYQDQIEAAYELYINHKELEQVYKSLATATGIASGKIVIGSKDMSTLGNDVGKLGGYTSTVGGYVSTLGNNVDITGAAFNTSFYGADGVFGTITKTGSTVQKLTSGIGASFENLSSGLLNRDSQMYKDLAALGPAIFNTIQLAAQEALDASPLNLKIDVKATMGKGNSVTFTPTVVDLTDPPMTSKNSTYVSPAKAAQTITGPRKAVGGPVTGMRSYMVGEKGPEMFIPKVSGTIVTNNALDRYTRTKETQTNNQRQNSANSIMVTVNNPVPQAAEESITRRMKVLSNQGLFG